MNLAPWLHTKTMAAGVLALVLEAYGVKERLTRNGESPLWQTAVGGHPLRRRAGGELPLPVTGAPHLQRPLMNGEHTALR